MNLKSLYTKYLKSIHEILSQGDAREESFYSALADMIMDVSHACGRNKVHITTLPKPTESGNPDFRIWDGDKHIYKRSS